MNLEGFALQLAGSLIDAGLVALDRKPQAAANLRASPPDVTASYHDAKAKLLGDADEIAKGGR